VDLPDDESWVNAGRRKGGCSMQWTKEKTTWLGTYREQRGTWHRIPYVLRTHSTRGMTRAGWIVVAALCLLLVAVVLVEELLF
jgi:hypothetical protein